MAEIERGLEELARGGAVTLKDVVRALLARDERLEKELRALRAEIAAGRTPEPERPQDVIPPRAGIPTEQATAEPEPAARDLPEQLLTADVPAPVEQPTKEKAPRIEYAGRFGSNAEAGVTKTNQPIVKARFAHHPDPTTTRWLTAVFLGKHAGVVKDFDLNGKQAVVIGGPEYDWEERIQARKRIQHCFNGYAMRFQDE